MWLRISLSKAEIQSRITALSHARHFMRQKAARGGTAHDKRTVGVQFRNLKYVFHAMINYNPFVSSKPARMGRLLIEILKRPN